MEYKKEFESTLKRLRRRYKEYKPGTFAYNKYKDAHDRVYMAYLNWEHEDYFIEALAEEDEWVESLSPQLRALLEREVQLIINKKVAEEEDYSFDDLEEAYLDDSRHLEIWDSVESDRE